MKKLFFLVLMVISSFSFSQVNFSGSLTNEKGEALFGANIIALPTQKSAKLAFTVVDKKGNFKLQLKENNTYTITISFIGYITSKFLVQIKNVDLTNQNYVLMEDSFELQEVEITYVPPIKITKDTTTYKVKPFVNGKERKLRQVLKKLPGVEVDKKGNVTVQGQKVSTILVEKKEFFTGDPKLGVNYLPADAVKEVQIIEDYQESELLKGFQKSNEIAMNINLKEDKKKFVFGTLEGGSGIKERYVLHPTIFKYSPKVSYSFIGDINNTGQKSFSIRDFIDFDGGLNEGGLSEILASPVGKILRDNTINDNTHKFGGVNLNWTVNKKNDINFFLLVVDDEVKSKSNFFRNYIDTNTFDSREITSENNRDIIYSKLTLKSAPNQDTRLKIDTKFNVIEGQKFQNNNLSSSILSSAYQLNSTIKEAEFTSKVNMEHRFSREKTLQFKTDFKFSKSSDSTTTYSGTDIFSSLLNLQNAPNFVVNNTNDIKNYQTDVTTKYFYKINPVAQLHFVASLNYKAVDNLTMANQQINTTSFLIDDFSNTLDFNSLTSKLSVDFKRVVGNTLLTLGVEYLAFNQFLKQENEELTSREVTKLLPNLDVDWAIDDGEALKFNYKIVNHFPRFTTLNPRNFLKSFNNVFRGNENLLETYYHRFYLRYNKSQTYGYRYNFSASHKIELNSLQNRVELDGINFYHTVLNNNSSQSETSLRGGIIYRHKYWNISFKPSVNFASYTSLLFDEVLSNSRLNYSLILGYSTYFLKGINLKTSLNYYKNIRKNRLLNFNNNRYSFDGGLTYEFHHFLLSGDYSFNYINSSTVNNFFDTINLSIQYKKTDSPWVFTANAYNLGNVINRVTRNSSSIFEINDIEFLFPRVVMFKVSYDF